MKADAELDQDTPANETMQADAQRLTQAVVEKASVAPLTSAHRDRTHSGHGGGQAHGDGLPRCSRRYIVYREERRKARAIRGDRTVDGQPQEQMFITLPDGGQEVLDPGRLKRDIYGACRGVEDKCQANDLFDETMRNLYDGVTTTEVDKAMIMSAKARIENEPAYTYVAARLYESDL